MDSKSVSDVLEGVIEELASVEHERWAHWQRYLHGQGVRQGDGSIVLPPELVARWEEQINKPYSALSDREKESDRDQVRKYLPIISSALSEVVG